MKTHKLTIVVSILFLTVFLISCKNDKEPVIENTCTFTVDEEIYTYSNMTWEIDTEYDLYYLGASEDNENNIAITLPKNIVKGGEYTKDISVNINISESSSYASYTNNVTIKVSDKTENVISGSFGGKFFYMLQGEMHTTEIKGTFTAIKKP